MGLPHTIRAPVEWQSFAPPRRLPMGAVVPGADAVALFVATAVLGHLSWIGLTFWVASFVALRAAGSHRARINPRLSDDIAGILARLAVATLVLVPFVPETQLGRYLRLAGPAVALVIVARGLGYKLIREAREALSPEAQRRLERISVRVQPMPTVEEVRSGLDPDALSGRRRQGQDVLTVYQVNHENRSASERALRTLIGRSLARA